jgi:hypothetical protein
MKFTLWDYASAHENHCDSGALFLLPPAFGRRLGRSRRACAETISGGANNTRRLPQTHNGRRSIFALRLDVPIDETSLDESPSIKEPTKTLRGALALVTRRKLLRQIRGTAKARTQNNF